MKKFNWRVFIIAAVVLVFLNFISWAGLAANDNRNGSHALFSVSASLWSILRFPIYTIFWRFLYGQDNTLLYSAAVFINCVFYAFIVERFFYFLRKNSKIQPVHTTYEA
jgi:FlaA1/EpsC-like NDP-sugar epimerase